MLVIFRNPEVTQALPAPHVRLTESILSEHRLIAGSGVGEIMERFVAQQSLKSNSEEWRLLDSVDDRVTYDVDTFLPPEDVVLRDDIIGANKNHDLERKEITTSTHSNSTHRVANTVHRQCLVYGETTESKSDIVFDHFEAVCESNPPTDEYDDGDNNLVVDDPKIVNPGEESSIKDHPIHNDLDGERSMNENVTTFTSPCMYFETSHQTPKPAYGVIDEAKHSGLEDKALLYSRLSNICRKSSVQARRTTGKLVRKRRILYNTDMTNTRKLLHRTSVTNENATSTHGKSPSRKTRATFPSSRSCAVETVDLKSTPKKTCAVEVVDLFGETESLFGCNVISASFVEHGAWLQNNEAQSGHAILSVDDNLELISDANTETNFNDANDKSKVSSRHGNEIAADISTVEDANDRLDVSVGVFLKNEVNAKFDDNIEKICETIDDEDNFSEVARAVCNSIATNLCAIDDSNDRNDVTKDGGGGDNLADAFDDEFSINSFRGTSFSLGSNNDDHLDLEATVLQSYSITHPFYDVYFGHENDQSTLFSSPSFAESLVIESDPFFDYYYGQESAAGTCEEEALFFIPPHSIYFGLRDDSDSSMHSNLGIKSLANPTTCTDSQPFHDHYYGQEKIIGLGSADQYACQSLRCVCFGLHDDSSDSSVQSLLDFVSLTSPTFHVPYYDYYLGQEDYLIEDNNNVNDETEKVVRTPRCVVQSQPLFVLVLLAGILSSAH
jgi:hypothetical protein